MGPARRGRVHRGGAQDQCGQVRQEGAARAIQGVDAEELDNRGRIRAGRRPALRRRHLMEGASRREFLTTTTLAGLAGILATGVPPARGQQREISYLCWNNFAPASDKKLAEIGQRFTKDTGIKIKIDHIAAPQQAARYASEVQSGAGHDLVEMRMHFPWLYENQLVDV